jgi:hypothetical protein
MVKTRGLKKYFGRQVTASVFVSWRGEEFVEDESDLAIVIELGRTRFRSSYIYGQHYII